MEKRIFKAGKGSTFNDENAQTYGEFLWQIREENGDTLNPAMVLEKARPKVSPIHNFFEWDDGIAGDKYRLWQARYLIGRIEIIVQTEEGEEQTRAFYNISVETEDEGHERGYVTIKDIQENEDYLEIVLENALGEIKSWQKRYSQYKRLKTFKPLKPLFKAIKETVKREARV